MSATVPSPSALPFGSRKRNRKPRNFRKTPYSELPSVLFKEEVKYLYDIIAEQRQQLESGVERGSLHAREIKLQLAHLQEKVHQIRTHMTLLRDTNDKDRAVLYAINQLVVVGQTIISIKKAI